MESTQSAKSGKRKVYLIALLALAVIGTGIFLYTEFCLLRRLHTLEPGVLYRSAQPQGGTFYVLDKHDIKLVISLRGYKNCPDLLAEERAACAEAGAELMELPINTRLPSEEQIEQFLQAVESAPGAVLVHCELGKSRTGIMSAAYRAVIQGWPIEKAMQNEVDPFMKNLQPEERKERGALIESVIARRSQAAAAE